MLPVGERRILVIVPGFGAPDLGTKVEILWKNMAMLPDNTRYRILNQNPTPDGIPITLLHNPRIQWVHEASTMGEFIHKWALPSVLREAGYTHVMILLNDTELLNMVQPDQLDLILDRYDLDILSPTLLYPTSTRWPTSMAHDPNHPSLAVRSQTMVELCCYYMRLDTYERYYRYIDPSNPWMRGMDLILSEYLRFGTAVMNMWVANRNHRPDEEPDDGTMEEDTMMYVGRYDPTLTMEALSRIPRTISEVLVQDLLYLHWPKPVQEKK